MQSERASQAGDACRDSRAADTCLAHGGLRHAHGDELQEEADGERQIIREDQPRRAPRQKLHARARARQRGRREGTPSGGGGPRGHAAGGKGVVEQPREGPG